MERETAQNLLGLLSSSFFFYGSLVLGWGSYEAVQAIMPMFLFHNIADTILGEYWNDNKILLLHHTTSSVISICIMKMTSFSTTDYYLGYWLSMLEISSIFNCARYFYKGTSWQKYFDISFGLSFIIFRPLAIYKTYGPAYEADNYIYYPLWLTNTFMNTYWAYCIIQYSKRIKSSFINNPISQYIYVRVNKIKDMMPSEHSLRTTSLELDVIKNKCEGLIPNIESTITFALISMMTTFTIIMSLILKYALYHHSQFQLFTLGSISVMSLYYVFNFCLDKYLPTYAALDKDRKYYILANIIKSGILAACCPYIGDIFINGLVYDNWDNNFIWNIGCVYTIPDFVSLFMVKRMARSTIIHHVCVCIFNIWSLSNNFEEENVCRAIMVYAVFSTYAYLVNFLLGTRFLIEEDVKYYLFKVALFIYVCSCAVNWSWQLHYMYHLTFEVYKTIHWSVATYAAAIALIVWDDIILMTWLHKNPKKIAEKQS